MIFSPDSVDVAIFADGHFELDLEVLAEFNFDGYFDEDNSCECIGKPEGGLTSEALHSESKDQKPSNLHLPSEIYGQPDVVPPIPCQKIESDEISSSKSDKETEDVENSELLCAGETLPLQCFPVYDTESYPRVGSGGSEGRNSHGGSNGSISDNKSASDDDLFMLDKLFAVPYFYSKKSVSSLADADDSYLLDLRCSHNSASAAPSKTNETNNKKISVPSLTSSLNSVFNEDELIDVLTDVTSDAEARLAARRQARAEAREIRMRELERQQRESEDSLDRHYDQLSDPVNRSNARLANSAVRAPALLSAGTGGTFSSSRRSSEDSTESEGLSYRDLRHELKELEDKFRKAMINNAQLDNEKSTLLYQVSSLKDEREELEENLAMIQKEHKEKCHDYEQMKRVAACLKEETNLLRRQLEEKDKLIKEHGLVIVCAGSEEEEGSHEKVLVSQETALLLEEAGEGSLDVRLRRFAESKNVLVDEIRRLKIELEEEKSRNLKMSKVSSSTMNGPELDMLEAQREANRLLGDYKFKLQKAEQENSTLQANVARLEGQVVRYKTMAETTEKASDELKIEKRRLQREMRERQTREEELVITNSHLQKRLDKLKTARSALLKDL